MSSTSISRAVQGVIAAAAVLLMSGVAFAQDYGDMSCDDLWVARNQIYANEGFCFKTQDAIQQFGRACFPPYGRLSSRETREVQEIQRAESENGCN
jgi:YARHG domain